MFADFVLIEKPDWWENPVTGVVIFAEDMPEELLPEHEVIR